MLKPLTWTLLLLVEFALAHGSHGHDGPDAGENIQQYAQRHMTSEHHIDSFDARSFFQLHDLNRNGYWERDEIEAIYGVHHVYSQKKSKDDIEHQKKADHIVAKVLQNLDLSGDGMISPEELESVGLGGLPDFDDLGAEGHHYDVESEFFLHHEEQFHSTPETQTDESYNHPEDLEHFAHHESIENTEARREADYQGVSVEELMQERALAAQAAESAAAASSKAAAIGDTPVSSSTGEGVPTDTASTPKVTRIAKPGEGDPATRYADVKANSEWGTGEGGYKPPTEPADKMRKNVPYKYKFRRNWGDF